MSEEIVPQIGMGATMFFGSDRRAATIIEVIDDKTIIVVPDIAKLTGGSVLDENQQYQFERGNGMGQVFTKRKNGRWIKSGQRMNNGTHLAVGHRSHYWDPCF